MLDVIEAGARAAVAASPGRRIGVIGTPTTINSNAYARRMHELDPAVRVYSQATLFVPLVEEGWLDHRGDRLTAGNTCAGCLEGVDSLVLGCTIPVAPLLRDVVTRVRSIDLGADRGLAAPAFAAVRAGARWRGV